MEPANVTYYIGSCIIRQFFVRKSEMQNCWMMQSPMLRVCCYIAPSSAEGPYTDGTAMLFSLR
jgi:hypothetical protein